MSDHGPRTAPEGLEDFMGFPVGTTMRAALAALLLASVGGCGAKHTTAPRPATATIHGFGETTHALAISADGRVVIGSRGYEDGWLSRDDGPGQFIGNYPAALTPDGAVIAGHEDLKAASWTRESRWVGLVDSDEQIVSSEAMGISADGRTIVGWRSAHATKW